MLDESTIVAKCANSVKPSKAGGSAAMVVSSIYQDMQLIRQKRAASYARS